MISNLHFQLAPQMMLKHSSIIATTGKVSWVLLSPVRAEQNEAHPSNANKTTSEFGLIHKEYLLIHHKPQRLGLPYYDHKKA